MLHKRVMIVDPSMYSRSVLSHILKSRGYSVCYEAKTGDDAIEMYGQVRPDFVLVEAQMPGRDGVATIKQLCKTHEDCLVFLCASSGQRGHISAALSAGAADFIPKPFNERSVVRTLVNASVTKSAEPKEESES